MRAVQLPANGTDCIHVYSDDQHIWLQLRREVHTEQDIGRLSFKVALCLTLERPPKRGLELLIIAERNNDKQKAKNAGSKAEVIRPAPIKPEQPQGKLASPQA